MEKFLSHRIASCLKTISDRSESLIDNKAWTSSITDMLCQIGKIEFNYTVAHPGHGGWMFDIAWLDYDDFDKRLLSRLVLAVESEWKTDLNNLRIDLNKLLIANAFLSVFIFQSRAKADVAHYLSKFQESINSINPPHQNAILFSAYNFTNKEFEFHFWDGRQFSELVPQ